MTNITFDEKAVVVEDGPTIPYPEGNPGNWVDFVMALPGHTSSIWRGSIIATKNTKNYKSNMALGCILGRWNPRPSAIVIVRHADEKPVEPAEQSGDE